MIQFLDRRREREMEGTGKEKTEREHADLRSQGHLPRARERNHHKKRETSEQRVSETQPPTPHDDRVLLLCPGLT